MWPQVQKKFRNPGQKSLLPRQWRDFYHHLSVQQAITWKWLSDQLMKYLHTSNITDNGNFQTQLRYNESTIDLNEKLLVSTFSWILICFCSYTFQPIDFLWQMKREIKFTTQNFILWKTVPGIHLIQQRVSPRDGRNMVPNRKICAPD